MKNEEILKKSKKKVIVGEMEQQKINGANWIALICAGLLAVVFMIVEGGTRSLLWIVCHCCSLPLLGKCVILLAIFQS